MNFKSTSWEIAGSSGLTIKAGTPVANVEIGASYIRMPVENKQAKKKVLLQGFGGGLGAGLSISTPVLTVSGSLDQFPSGGIGKIIAGVAVPNRPFKATDFLGEMMVFGLSAGKEITGQLSGVLWLKESVETCMLHLNCSSEELTKIAIKLLLKMYGVAIPPVGAATSLHDLYSRTKAAGCFVAMNAETQLLGVGAEIFSYRVKI